MLRAVEAAERVHGRTSPNPWVGAVLVSPPTEGLPSAWFTGATAPPGGPHAEVAALAAAGEHARGGTLYVTLEPCAHQGRTPPCVDAIVAAGVRRVVVGIADPDPQVDGRGIAALRRSGVDVEAGVAADVVGEQLAPYVTHRRTGRPWVALKLAATLDGRIAAPDGSSQMDHRGRGPPRCTPAPCRVRRRPRGGGNRAGRRPGPHRAPARGRPVLPGTRRAADPGGAGYRTRRRRRAARTRAVGTLGDILDELGSRGVVQILVEGGSGVAHDVHAAGLVDRYVVYLAPALFGGDDARPLFAGPGAATIGDLWRGEVRSVTSLGGDVRVELVPAGPPG